MVVSDRVHLPTVEKEEEKLDEQENNVNYISLTIKYAI